MPANGVAEANVVAEATVEPSRPSLVDSEERVLQGKGHLRPEVDLEAIGDDDVTVEPSRHWFCLLRKAFSM